MKHGVWKTYDAGGNASTEQWILGEKKESLR